MMSKRKRFQGWMKKFVRMAWKAPLQSRKAAKMTWRKTIKNEPQKEYFTVTVPRND